MPAAPSIIAEIERVVGAAGMVGDPAAMAPYLVDYRELYHGRTAAVVRPADAGEVAAVVRICAGAGIGIVPQGGNTGLVGGGVPDESGEQILLSLARLNRVREVDPLNFTLLAEAGCVLSSVQAAAEEAGLLFPLSLGAEGSCQIGGNLSTNAGGTGVLRYGNARDLVLGLEVVLPDGEIWDGLKTLRKDNTGYDLKQLFIGSEGTLGIITAAALELFPRPGQLETAFVAVADPDAALRLLRACRDDHGDVVTAFEYVNGTSLELTLEHVEGTRRPVAGQHDHYVLLEVASGERDGSLRDGLEVTLGRAAQAGDVLDATVAASAAQAAALWRIREHVPDAARLAGAGIKHDISVPVSSVPEFLRRANDAVRAAIPGVVIVAFGHAGDGNLHYNLNQPPEMPAATFLAATDAVNDVVYDIALGLDGSFSAEHGIGRLRRRALERYKAPVELRLMRAVKRAIDPRGIFNPGKLL